MCSAAVPEEDEDEVQLGESGEEDDDDDDQVQLDHFTPCCVLQCLSQIDMLRATYSATICLLPAVGR